jgi:hypothetical protein
MIGALVFSAMVKAAADKVTEAFGPNAVHHHFAGGVYAKEARIPTGGFVVSHSHPYDHLSILAAGRVRLEGAGGVRYLRGPIVVEIKKGVEHKVTALTDAVWYCIHATAETDPEKVDDVILSREET